MPDERALAGRVGGCGDAQLTPQELEAGESSTSPLVRLHLSPLALLVIALRRLLKGKTPIERERQETRSHQPVFEWSFHKGCTGESLLDRLYVDETEVIDPQSSTWPQHPVDVSQGLLEFKPMMHADGRCHYG